MKQAHGSSVRDFPISIGVYQYLVDVSTCVYYVPYRCSVRYQHSGIPGQLLRPQGRRSNLKG